MAASGEDQAGVEPEVEQYDGQQQCVGADGQVNELDISVRLHLPEVVAVQVDVGQRHYLRFRLGVPGRMALGQ